MIEGEQAKDLREQSRDLMQYTSLLMGGLFAAGILPSPGCMHPHAVPVESIVTGELLARLCPDCDMQISTDQHISTEEMDERPRFVTGLADTPLSLTMGKRIWLSL